MSIFNIKLPNIIITIPGTPINIIIDNKTTEAATGLILMALIIIGVYVGVIDKTYGISLISIDIGWLATKIFGITGSGN